MVLIGDDMPYLVIDPAIKGRVDSSGSIERNLETLHLSVIGSISFRNYVHNTLPEQFDSVSGTLFCENAEISSLMNMPIIVGALCLRQCNKLKTLDFPRPIIIEKTLDISSSGINTLHNIHKNIKFVESIIAVECNLTSSLAGLLLVNGLKKFQSSMPDFDLIINDYFKSSKDEYQSTIFAEKLGIAGYEHLLEL